MQIRESSGASVNRRYKFYSSFYFTVGSDILGATLPPLSFGPSTLCLDTGIRSAELLINLHQRSGIDFRHVSLVWKMPLLIVFDIGTLKVIMSDCWYLWPTSLICHVTIG